MEKLRTKYNRLAIVSVLGLGSLGLAACGTGSETTEGEKPKAQEVIEGAGVTYTYYDDGSRLTEYGSRGYTDVLSICDGYDLVDQTRFTAAAKKAAGNAIARAVNHPACEDGKLTPEDFAIPR